MPLPADGVFALQGHSRPGDTVQSNVKKQAVIVRLSEEAFKLLETYPNQPPMEFEFGENPGIYIGDNFFHLQNFKENIPHDLYLRASSLGKPMAPLKQYATITGKLTVDRSRDSNVAKKLDANHAPPVTGITADAVTLKAEMAERHRKHAGPASLYTSMFRKPVQSADHQLITQASGSHPYASIPPPSNPAREELAPLRRQLIHSLALNQQQGTDDVIKLLCTRNDPERDSPPRSDVLSLLEDVAEEIQPLKKSGETPGKVWRLKTRSWLEVRPYEWPHLTEQNRTSMARAARLAYGDLGIPEKDPAWNHVRYRNSLGASSAAPPTQTPKNTSTSKAKPSKVDAIKRGISTKEKTTTSKVENAKLKSEVPTKSATTKNNGLPANATSGVGATSKVAVETTAKAIPAASAPRRPGSGFKVTKSSPSDSPDPSHKPIETDTRRTDKDPPTRSTATPLPIAQSRKEVTASPAQITRIKTESAPSNLDMDNKAKGKGKDKQQSIVPEIDRTRSHKTDNDDERSSVGFKRKKIRDADDESVPQSKAQKKRRTDHDPVSSSSNKQDSRVRDLSLPQKPETVVPPHPKPKKTKREPSPPQQPKQDPPPRPLPRPKIKDLSPTPSSVIQSPMRTHKKVLSGSSSASTHHQSELSTDRPAKSNSNNKVRRRSPIYTSSEDEDDARPSKVSKRSVTSASATRPPTRPSKPTQSPAPPANADASLREKYRDRYTVYIATFHRLHTQHRKMELLHQKAIRLNVGPEDIPNSDPELLDPEELHELMDQYVAVEQELKQMIDEHAKLTKV